MQNQHQNILGNIVANGQPFISALHELEFLLNDFLKDKNICTYHNQVLKRSLFELNHLACDVEHIVEQCGLLIHYLQVEQAFH